MSNAQLASFKVPQIENEPFVRRLVQDTQQLTTWSITEALCPWLARTKPPSNRSRRDETGSTLRSSHRYQRETCEQCSLINLSL